MNLVIAKKNDYSLIVLFEYETLIIITFAICILLVYSQCTRY